MSLCRIVCIVISNLLYLSILLNNKRLILCNLSAKYCPKKKNMDFIDAYVHLLLHTIVLDIKIQTKSAWHRKNNYIYIIKQHNVNIFKQRIFMVKTAFIHGQYMPILANITYMTCNLHDAIYTEYKPIFSDQYL